MAPASEVCMPPYNFPQSAWQMFEDGVNINPDAPVLTACHQPADHYVNLLPEESRSRPGECLRWTYRELRHASLIVAKAMVDAGVKRGTTIVAPLPNGIETHIVRIVSFILQLTLVALDQDLVEQGRQDELNYFIQTIAPEIVVVPDAEGAKAVGDAVKQINFTFDQQFLTQDSEAPGWISWAKLRSQEFSVASLEDLAGQQQADLDKRGDRVALILFTSGTSTGRPKGCPQTVLNIVSASLNQMSIADIATSYALWSPHSRAIYSCWGLTALASGHHIIQAHTHFTPDKAYAAVERHNVEQLLFVPAQLKIIAAQKHLDWTKLTSVRRIMLGGDIITTDLIEKAEQLFPRAKVTTLWGMTEGSAMIGLKGTDIAPPLRNYHSIVTVGKVGRSANVRILDLDGNITLRGEAGELVVSGPGMVDHYINNVQPELFYRDEIGSWIRTGDKAIMDEDGFIYLIGRIKDIIKQSGINLSPAVLEATLNKHEGINAAVIGVPDPIKGEVPVAVNPGKMTDRLASNIKSLVRASLGQDYALKEVYGLSNLGMKEFPFNSQGKLQKFKLKNAIMNFERKKLIGEMFYPWFI